MGRLQPSLPRIDAAWRVAAFATFVLVTSASVAAAQSATDVPAHVVDRLVAVVDEDPIFLSDLDRAFALDALLAPAADPQQPAAVDTLPASAAEREQARRQMLDRLIEQRLRGHEVERYDLGPVSSRQVDEQMAPLVEAFGGEEALARRLGEQGMALADLRAQLGRQLRILRFVEERLGPRVLVDEEAIHAYYDGELAAEMARQGNPLPALEAVREAIRAVLQERALNLEIERWTDELRADARIVDLFVRRQRPLPDLVLEIEAPGGDG